MFSLISAWINSWVNTGEAGDLRRHRADYDVSLMDPTKDTHILLWRRAMGCFCNILEKVKYDFISYCCPLSMQYFHTKLVQYNEYLVNIVDTDSLVP